MTRIVVLSMHTACGPKSAAIVLALFVRNVLWASWSYIG